MKGLGPLLKKELKEQLRTYRLVIVGGIFLLFGITTPLLLKYLPKLLELAGEQIPIELPTFTAADSLIEYASNIPLFGILMAVLLSMGAIAGERRRGTAVMTLSKPVSPAAFVSAKFAAVSLTFLVSIAASSAVCFGYSVWLLGPADGLAFTGLNLLMVLFVVFSIAVTLLFSSLFRSSLAAAGIAIGIFATQAGLAAVPVISDYLPGAILDWANGLVLGIGGTYWWALGETIFLTGLCLYLSQQLLKNRDL